tara:strand:+ start:1800 stop:2897 length:1098 start_codon:yes stop_codon:yes gene_type:complete
MRKFPGLIPGRQDIVGFENPSWQYGNIVDGVKQIDPLLHFSCFVLGFERFDIIDYVCDQMKMKPEVAESFIMEDSNLRLNDVSWQLAEQLYNMCGYKSIFALSGSDANEGAIKLASAYQHQLGQHQRKKIVTFNNSYHGSTFLTNNLGDSLFDNPFYTLNRYTEVVRLSTDFNINDTNWDEVLCVMVETCQYAQQLQPHSDEFWNKMKQLQAQGVVLILDDIFIGGGKTGSFVGWRNLPVKPDIFTMGKAVTAGYFPLSITLYGDRIDQVLPDNFDWEHGFTYNYSLPGILSCFKYIDILHKEMPLDNHFTVQQRAQKVFESQGYIVNSVFGLLFSAHRGDTHKFFIVPVNATDEYFEILEQQIK